MMSAEFIHLAKPFLNGKPKENISEFEFARYSSLSTFHSKRASIPPLNHRGGAMLAGQLLAIAQDMIRDYDRLKVIPTLERAVEIAANRPNMNEPEFQTAVRDIKSAAEKMLNETIVRVYSIDLKRTLAHSGYSQSLPDAIAKTLTVSFGNRRKDSAISSQEINMYLGEAKSFYGKMQHLVDSARAFGVETYQAPEGQVVLEISIPDLVYGRTLGQLPPRIARVEGVLNVMEELVKGSRSPHKILWVATTDLVIAIPLDWSVVLAALILYERMLAVTEKHLNIAKLIRDLFKNSGAQNPELEKTLKDSVDAALDGAVKDVIKLTEKAVDEPRQNELAIELKAVSRAMIADFAMGLRFGIDPRHELKLIAETEDERGAEEATQRLENRRKLELSLEAELGKFPREEILLLAGELKTSEEASKEP